MEFGKGGLEERKVAFDFGGSAGKRRALHAGKPDAVGSEDVNEGAKHATVGREEVAIELFRREQCRGFHEAAGGPGSVIEMVRDDLGRNRHHNQAKRKVPLLAPRGRL